MSDTINDRTTQGHPTVREKNAPGTEPEPLRNGSQEYHPRELLITTIADLLMSCRHVAVGASSPIPAAAALLARHRSLTANSHRVRVSLLGSRRHSSFTDGGKELFDCAAQGRIDAFFLSGVQIDGQANINLVGLGDYPSTHKRFAGSFGSAYLYHLVPKVILFSWMHTAASLVPKVDFISASGTHQPGEYRPGGPWGLMTNRCLFQFDRTKHRFKLLSVHPGETIQSVKENTGFEFDCPDTVSTTALPSADDLVVLRESIANELTELYPRFSQRLWG